MAESKQFKKALQLDTDHLCQRIVLVFMGIFLDGITKNIFGFFGHDFYITPLPSPCLPFIEFCRGQEISVQGQVKVAKSFNMLDEGEEKGLSSGLRR
jgi:hypothetical protein